VSKKRPSIPPAGKFDAAYWRARLFRNTYTLGGKRFETNHWSVKIQHLGERKTFSLAARQIGKAAAEAGGIYRGIVREGWRSAVGARKRSRKGGHQIGSKTADQSQAGYWRERLIRRPYTMGATITGELSVRMEHEGVGHYFPLGTGDENAGANEALRIHQMIARLGWERAARQLNRELTIGFRWIDNPLAWTYTTICTSSTLAAKPRAHEASERAGKIGVAIVERDAGIRQALAWCLDQMVGFYCAATFGSALRAVAESRAQPCKLMLVSQRLADGPGLAQLSESIERGGQGAMLRYATYPDSETLFAATPGGAIGYLLRRRAPSEFLEPIHELNAANFSNPEIASRAWNYFKELFSARPAGGAGEAWNRLTQREHEVLGLLSSGHPDKEIADRLGISIYTVHGHVRNIFEKLGVHNRTGAVVKYLQK
jgi:DNA-binding NarL/FixJ family response regulator